MKNGFQLFARRELSEFAQRNQLIPHPIAESGNGTEYKNHLNKTIFTVYHERLDKENSDRIEIAIGVSNISSELSCTTETVYNWLSKIQSSLHPAKSKSPLMWPRLAVWSSEEVKLFCQAFDDLTTLKHADPAIKQTSEGKRLKAPPIDEKVMREILTRRGQQAFRSGLLHAYGGRCAISGCTDIEILEAAHIVAHSEKQDYRPTNGLLLRADLHTLFDLRLIAIDPRTAEVVISKHLSATYQYFNGHIANLPSAAEYQPDASALMQHFILWQAREQITE